MCVCVCVVCKYCCRRWGVGIRGMCAVCLIYEHDMNINVSYHVFYVFGV